MLYWLRTYFSFLLLCVWWPQCCGILCHMILLINIFESDIYQNMNTCEVPLNKPYKCTVFSLFSSLQHILYIWMDAWYFFLPSPPVIMSSNLYLLKFADNLPVGFLLVQAVFCGSTAFLLLLHDPVSCCFMKKFLTSNFDGGIQLFINTEAFSHLLFSCSCHYWKRVPCGQQILSLCLLILPDLQKVVIRLSESPKPEVM